MRQEEYHKYFQLVAIWQNIYSNHGEWMHQEGNHKYLQLIAIWHNIHPNHGEWVHQEGNHKYLQLNTIWHHNICPNHGKWTHKMVEIKMHMFKILMMLLLIVKQKGQSITFDYFILEVGIPTQTTTFVGLQPSPNIDLVTIDSKMERIQLINRLE